MSIEQLYKCAACGNVWTLEQLHTDPTSLCGSRNRCCGDFFCGANCYPVKEKQEAPDDPA